MLPCSASREAFVAEERVAPRTRASSTARTSPTTRVALAHAIVHALQGVAIRGLLLLRDALAALDEPGEVQDLLVVRHRRRAEGDDRSSKDCAVRHACVTASS